MRKTILPFLLFGFALIPIAAGCRSEHKASSSDTDTIAPARPANSTEGDGDAVTTQTMEIGEDRSPDEGGILASSETATSSPSTATTSTTTTHAPAPKPKKPARH